jgi:guanylate kinase
MKTIDTGMMLMTANGAAGKFIVVVGPGGAGKDTLMRRTLEALRARQVPIHPLVTATTRAPRPNEVDGISYHFKTHDEFQRMIDNDELIEHQQVTTGNYYGIPRRSVDEIVQRGEHVMGDIDVYGAMYVRDHYPNVVLVFVSVGTPEMSDEERLAILRERMTRRGDPPAAVEERLERARNLELAFAEQCDAVIYNNQLDQATREMTEAILRFTHQTVQE